MAYGITNLYVHLSGSLKVTTANKDLLTHTGGGGPENVLLTITVRNKFVTGVLVTMKRSAITSLCPNLTAETAATALENAKAMGVIGSWWEGLVVGLVMRSNPKGGGRVGWVRLSQGTAESSSHQNHLTRAAPWCWLIDNRVPRSEMIQRLLNPYLLCMSRKVLG